MFFKPGWGRWALLRGRACSAVLYAVERRQKVRTSIVYFGFSLNFSMDTVEQEDPCLQGGWERVSVVKYNWEMLC